MSGLVSPLPDFDVVEYCRNHPDVLAAGEDPFENHCKREANLDDVIQLGLFDDKWYLAAYPDVESADADAFSHYCVRGWKEGRQPNFYFDPEWYCANYPQVHTVGRNPLCDYAVRGEKEGACPSPHFDTNWYRAQQGLGAEDSPLRHYLLNRLSGLVSPLPGFDVVKYCQNHPDVLTAGHDPFENHCKREAEGLPRARKRTKALP
jgi:hypothetical protein